MQLRAKGVSQLEEAGSDGFSDFPRSGRPYKVPDAIIEEIPEGRNTITPKDMRQGVDA